jgi:hypothetical protein
MAGAYARPVHDSSQSRMSPFSIIADTRQVGLSQKPSGPRLTAAVARPTLPVLSASLHRGIEPNGARLALCAGKAELPLLAGRRAGAVGRHKSPIDPRAGPIPSGRRPRINVVHNFCPSAELDLALLDAYDLYRLYRMAHRLCGRCQGIEKGGLSCRSKL